MIPIVVEGFGLMFSPPVVGSKETNVSIISMPSEHAKIDGKKIYSGDMKLIVSNTTIPGYQQSDAANITISPSVLSKVKVDGKVCIGVGDNGSATGSYTNGISGGTSQLITVIITDAGQSEVMGT